MQRLYICTFDVYIITIPQTILERHTNHIYVLYNTNIKFNRYGKYKTPHIWYPLSLMDKEKPIHLFKENYIL